MSDHTTSQAAQPSSGLNSEWEAHLTKLLKRQHHTLRIGTRNSSTSVEVADATMKQYVHKAFDENVASLPNPNRNAVGVIDTVFSHNERFLDNVENEIYQRQNTIFETYLGRETLRAETLKRLGTTGPFTMENIERALKVVTDEGKVKAETAFQRWEQELQSAEWVEVSAGVSSLQSQGEKKDENSSRRV